MRREAADIVIIGAGIMGLSIAYHLAKNHRQKNIVVVDASYLCGGASGRNGGGVRAQWSSEALIRLMQESLQLCREFAREGRAGVVVLRLGKIVEDPDTPREAYDPLWIDQRDAVQAVTKALHARLMGTDQLAHPWSVFHVSSRLPQARFTCDRAKRAFAYAPQFP